MKADVQRDYFSYCTQRVFILGFSSHTRNNFDEIREIKLEKYISNYKTGFVGWKIEHIYRAPNKIGALELEDDIFIIEPDFSKADYKSILLP